MEDFIELGIEGVDKIVDKHFHKVPDKYVDPHTYRPRLHHRKRGHEEKRSRRDDDEDSINDSERDEDRESARPEPRQHGRTNLPPYQDHPESYSSGAYEYVAPSAAAAAGYGYNYPSSIAGLNPQQPRYVPNLSGAVQDLNDNRFGYLPPPPRSSTFQDDRSRRKTGLDHKTKQFPTTRSERIRQGKKKRRERKKEQEESEQL
ncbi:hypothetical protein BDZ45DRAFT_677317 [Acephala macrosclerotiorum]|nr:hypothetical protein BDZ45DRAFT_677317 [Acephala macrosclerotiorum]